MTDRYSVIKYTSKVHSGRDPSRIAAVAALYGIESPPLSNASILEIGCGTGEALLGLSQMYPDARLYGIDPSEDQIQEGLAMARELGAANVSLDVKQVGDLCGSSGSFDYIICHGVFSWVTPGAGKDILRVFNHLLSAKGLGYLSYNTWPGWNFRRIIRDLLLSNIDGSAPPVRQVEESRKLLKMFESAVGFEFERPYSMMMSSELRRIMSEPDSYLFHEFLEPENHPVFFHEMAGLLDRAGLVHIADARLSRNELFRLDREQERQAVEISERFRERTVRECFLDFAFHTPFRESIICRKGRVPETAADAGILEKFFFSSAYQAVEGEPDLRTDIDEEFMDPAGQHIFVSRPALKASLEAMHGAWPGALSFDALWNGPGAGVRKDEAQAGLTPDRFASMLLDLAGKDYIDFRLAAPGLAVVVSGKPEASPLARLQARRGSLVTNLRYESVEIDDFQRDLLQFLDGTRTREDLVNMLLHSLAERGARIHEGGEEIQEPERRRELVITLLGDGLELIRKAGLLVR